MFKLVVLFAVLAVAAARPGYLHSYPAVAVAPIAVAHTYRTDHFHKPLVAAYTVPVVNKIVAAPIAYHAPLLAYPHHPW